MLSPEGVADVVFDEFAQAGVAVDFPILCYAMDMTERVGVPEDQNTWRRVVRDEVAAFVHLNEVVLDGLRALRDDPLTR